MKKNEIELDRAREILHSNPKGLTIAEIARLLNLNRISTSKYLNMLLAAGQAEMRVHGPSRVFYPSQRVPLASILNYSASLMIVLDENLRIIDASRAVLDFFSLKKDDLIGRNILFSPITSYIDPSLIPDIRLDLKHAAIESRDNTVEIKFEIGHSERFLRIKSIPTIFESGDHGVTLIGEDITELTLYRRRLEEMVEERSRELHNTNKRLLKMIESHKKAKSALKTSEKKYRELVENANSIILKTDFSGNITFINEFAQKFFGYSEKEILGKNVLDTIVPEDASYNRDPEKIREAITRYPDNPDSQVSQNIRRDKERVWISWTNKSIRDAKGNVRGLLAIGNDITARIHAEEVLERSEQKLSAIINFLPDATFVIDTNGVVIAWNHATVNLTGMKSEDILGKGGYEYSLAFFGVKRPMLIDFALHPEWELPENYHYVRQGDTLITETFSSYVNPAGVFIWATAAALYDSSGNIIGAIESLRDITGFVRQQDCAGKGT